MHPKVQEYMDALGLSDYREDLTADMAAELAKAIVIAYQRGIPAAKLKQQITAWVEEHAPNKK